jgi:hypothetical protein
MTGLHVTRILLVILALAFVSPSPVFAWQCPVLHHILEEAIANRLDAGAARARDIAAEGLKLHYAGKHGLCGQAQEKYAEAARAAGIKLGRGIDDLDEKCQRERANSTRPK